MTEFVSYTEARKHQKSNPAPRWHAGDSHATESLASERFKQRFFPPALAEPKFRIGANENFFMIGSCFARGLEAALAVRKMNVLSKSPAFDRWPVAATGAAPAGATNKYNLGSICNEIAWAVGAQAFPDEAFVALGNGKFYDPHMTPVFAPADEAEVRLKREVMTDVVARIRDANVIVLTLGLVEVWKDMATGLITNATPNPLACRKEPDRFVFGRLDYATNMSVLERIYQRVQEHCPQDFRIVLTVSPVPLEATFTERDVVEATTYSKSLLRAVAEDFASRHQNVAYFPSYEIVMNTPRQNAWMEDCRHVRGELASFIIGHFLRHFAPQVEVAPGERLVSAAYVG